MSGSRPYATVATRAHHRVRSALPLLAVASMAVACTDEVGQMPLDPQHPVEPDGREFILTTIEDTADCDRPDGECSLYGAIEAAHRDPDSGPYTIALPGDETNRFTLPALRSSENQRDGESTLVIGGRGATAERGLSGHAIAFGGGEGEVGGWQYKWDEGSQASPRDVYFVDDAGALRNPDGATPDDAELFNVAGAPLDPTWGEYRQAEGRSLAIVSPGDEPTTTFIVYFQGLVPDGVYSAFYNHFGPDSANPLCPGAVMELPIPSIVPSWQRPDASSFVADRNGRALYVGRVDDDLLAPELSSVYAIYHADGETYHPAPNRRTFETQGEENCRSSYGVDAMRHVVIFQRWF